MSEDGQSPRPGERVIPCPRCDTDVGDYLPQDRAAHLAKCRGRWIQRADGSWAIADAKARPKILYCHACGEVHHNPVNMECRRL